MMIPVQMPEGAKLHCPDADHATLEGARPGSRLRVCAVRANADLRRRLLEMGFVSGTALRVVRLAPFGDPMQVELRGYHLSLRRSEARSVLVRPA
jgi:ferrous iron transport protein A